MPDSSDQTIRQLQQEIKKLKKTLGQKGKELEQKGKELDLERGLWKTRHDIDIPVDAGRAALLHRLETLDGIINDEALLHAATLHSREEFEYILERFEEAIIKSEDAPLFRNNEMRSDDPGNRCSLYPRHALLMCLLRLKDNPTQGTLEAFFGIDQSNVCRYLQFCNRMLEKILPTPRKISEEISRCKTVKELKEFIPGRGAGTLLVDGTHIPVRRSGDKERRKETYSGKKKRHTFNTTIVSATNNIILGIGSTVVGKTHDITLLREDPIPFGRWAEKMHDGSNPKGERFTAYMDLGYRGMQKDLLGANVIMPHKRPRKRKGEKEARKLTDEQKKHNKKVGGIMVTVENSIGRIKQYARMTEPYGGTEDELNCEMNVVAGLVNLHLMKTLHRGSPKLRRRFLG